MSEVTRNDIEWARSGIKLSPPPTLVYCPYHERWENIVDDDDLCEWCCQTKPCLLHPDDIEDGVVVMLVVDETTR